MTIKVTMLRLNWRKIWSELKNAGDAPGAEEWEFSFTSAEKAAIKRAVQRSIETALRDFNVTVEQWKSAKSGRVRQS